MSKPVKRSTQDIKGLDEKIVRLDDLRGQVKGLNADIAELQEEVLEDMASLGLNSRTVRQPNGKPLKATRMQNTSLVFNEPALRKRLGSVLWNKVSTRSLDKRKLEQQIAEGNIAAQILAECSEEKTTKPFVKVS